MTYGTSECRGQRMVAAMPDRLCPSSYTREADSREKISPPPQSPLLSSSQSAASSSGLTSTGQLLSIARAGRAGRNRHDGGQEEPLQKSVLVSSRRAAARRVIGEQTKGISNGPTYFGPKSCSIWIVYVGPLTEIGYFLAIVHLH
jgi:hypothetical protein